MTTQAACHWFGISRQAYYQARKRQKRGVRRDLLRELPALTKGQVIIAGQAVNTPILCRVRTRYTYARGRKH